MKHAGKFARRAQTLGLKGTLLAGLLCAAGLVHAESSVTLYGLIDTGIDYVNNVTTPGIKGGHSMVQMASGIPIGSNWGLRGSESLGNGLSAIFNLQSGFNVDNGAFSNPKSMFSRNAYVGLSSDQYGTLTFGRQWDPIVDVVEGFSLNGNYGGWYFSHPNDMDNTDNGFSVPNDVKYVSPSIHGLKFEAHYSFGGQAGQFSNDSAYGGSIAYENGPFKAGVAYLRVNNPQTAVVGYQSGGGYVNSVYGNALAQARSQQIIAGGASYQFGPFRLLGDASSVKFQRGSNGQNLNFQNYELSGIYSLTPTLNFGAGYTYTAGQDHGTGEHPDYQQFNLIVHYDLSKRTGVYLMSAFQRALGSAQYAQLAGFNPSSTNKQVVVRMGLTHTF